MKDCGVGWGEGLPWAGDRAQMGLRRSIKRTYSLAGRMPMIVSEHVLGDLTVRIGVVDTCQDGG